MDDEKQIQKLEDCLTMCKDTWLRLESVLDDIYDGEMSVSDAIEKAKGMAEDIANTLKP